MPYELVETDLTLIDPNPHRNLATYPWIEPKIEQLIRSIKDVGFWAGVIARPKGQRVELAFGHHRIEAARRSGLSSVPVILGALSDQDMIKFMGRENGEDYNSDFLIMLNTWEGAVQFFPSIDGKPTQPADIARLLGWTQPHKAGGVVNGTQMTPAAAACAAAYELVRHKHISRSDLRGLSVSDARELVVVTHKDITDIQRAAVQTKTPAADVAKAKEIIARSAKVTAQDVRTGRVLQRNIRTEVRLNVLRDTRRTKPKLLPLFSTFGKAVITKIDNMLHDDRAAQHIDQIAKELVHITQEEDHALIRNLHHSLNELSRRTSLAIRKTTPSKVVNLKAITTGAS